MKFYLGTKEPTWLGRSPAPLFISIASERKFGRRPPLNGWAMDSGAFTQIQRGGWTEEPAEYVDRAYSLADRVGGVDWIAPQDWMCEPEALSATGLTVEEHQLRTVLNYLELKENDERDWIIPVLQGWAPGQHERCLELYSSHGVSLRKLPLVGVGTICRRQDTHEIERIIRTLHQEGLKLHGFGVKVGGLRRYGRLLESADSMAWSYAAYMDWTHRHKGLCGQDHSCVSCFDWAHQWYEKVISQGRPS